MTEIIPPVVPPIELRRCPLCLSSDIDGAKPTIELARPGVLWCSICGREFSVHVKVLPPS